MTTKAIEVTHVFWDGNKLMAVPKAALENPDSKPVATYEQVMDAMLALRKGTTAEQQFYEVLKDKPLYTTPQPAPVVPQGWKPAPTEPTLDMLIAGAQAKAQGMDGDEKAAIYRAMISAAPEASAVQPLTDDVVQDMIKCLRPDAPLFKRYEVLVSAAIKEFCRINGIGAPKEPQRDSTDPDIQTITLQAKENK